MWLGLVVMEEEQLLHGTFLVFRQGLRKSCKFRTGHVGAMGELTGFQGRIM
jgi:hypothetical protein